IWDNNCPIIKRKKILPGGRIGSVLFKITKSFTFLNIQKGFVDQSDYVFNIVPMYRFHGGVHVSKGKGYQGGSHSAVTIGKGIGIRTGKPGGCHTLKWDLAGFRSFNNSLP